MEIAVGFLPSRSLQVPQTNHINATIMSPACPQITTGTVFAKYEPEIITASAPTNGKIHLPVIIWFYGGEGVSGGTDVLAWYPGPWVGRSQEHIVVAVQYRVSVFGFPASRALKDQNLDILDQRAGIERVHKNIAQFGGSPAQMILWGQSAGAGAGSVDTQNFAYRDEPIVKDTVGTKFSVASYFGCSGSAQHELNCPRKVPASNITAYFGSLNDSGLKFSLFIDNRVVFNNFTERYLGKHLSNKPAIFGSNLDEGTLWYGATTSAAAKATALSIFGCSVPYSTALRQSPGLTAYRYQYRGNSTNIPPKSGLGAYHFAELPLSFGTSSIYGRDSRFEKDVSVKMQDRCLAFAKDPEIGPSKQGWPGSTSGEVLLLVNSVNQIVSSLVADNVIDNACTSYHSSYLV
ncbi:hypothetical protein N7490_004558 [Penicillium lividum]|nr:hypothetical protein N7490_004558 [Penicillium lividum]